MKITYTYSRESLKRGARYYLMHRHQFITLLLPVLGLFFLSYGAYRLVTHDESSKAFPAILIALGAFYLYRFAKLTRTMIKNAFASNPNERQVTIDTTDENLTIQDDASSATSAWSVLVDFKICKTGILLYPQKNIFYWIPDTAIVTGGTWQDFEALISKKITRKI